MRETIDQNRQWTRCGWMHRGSRVCSQLCTDVPKKLVSKCTFAVCSELERRANVRARTCRRMQSKSVKYLVCVFLRRYVRQIQKLGIMQTKLAKRMKVSRPYVTKILSSDVNITFGMALRLARALEMDFVPELCTHNAYEQIAHNDEIDWLE